VPGIKEKAGLQQIPLRTGAGMRISLPYPLEGWTFLKPAAGVHPAAGILQVFLLLVFSQLYCNTSAFRHEYM
jgi:hypothetical protein